MSITKSKVSDYIEQNKQTFGSESPHDVDSMMF